MTKLLKLNHLFLATWLFLIYSAVTQAAELTFTPATPLVEINKTFTLSVQGAVGTVKWTTIEGTIQGDGLQVTYLAPAQAGLDAVTVLDSAGNLASVKVVITPPQTFSLKNAQWEIFTNRDWVTALAMSEDGKTLWVGTGGGLEKRNIQTGDLQQVLTNLDGLPDNSINALLHDSQGGLWVGTYEGGLAHYVQKQWQVFNTNNSGLPDNRVTAILPDSQGGLWIGTYEGGLAHYAQGQWQVFNTDNSGLPSNFVSAILPDRQGGLWIGTSPEWDSEKQESVGGGLAYLNKQGQWQVFNTDNSSLLSNEVNALLPDNQGGLWVGTYEGGLAHYAQGQWQVFNTNNSGLPNNRVTAILPDSQGGLWIGTWEGLAHYAQGQWQVFNTDNSGLPNNYVNALHPDNQGGLWVGTHHSGLTHYAQGQWQVFNTDNSGLPANMVRTLLPDSQGGLWVGTLLSGLAHYMRGQWQVFNMVNSDLSSNSVSTLLQDSQGGLWVGTILGGLAHYVPGGQWQVFNTDNSDLLSNSVSALLPDGQGGLWVGTYEGGLAHYAQGWGSVFNTDNSGLPSNSVSALLPDLQGGLWVGTSPEWDFEKPESVGGGLAYLNALGRWQVFNTDNSGLPSNSVSVLLPDHQGGLWIGTSPEWDSEKQESIGGGLAYLNKRGQWQVFNTDNSSLPDNEVSALHPDSQSGLWVGTYKGLAHYAQGQWQVFNTDNSGLPDHHVYALLPDSQGGLWVGTSGGLAHLTFGRQAELCTQAQIDTATCQALLTSHRAAILVAGGGAQSDNTLWDATEAITTRFYQMLIKRGFNKDEIYYLSSKTWADFNGDGFNDHINRLSEDREITIDDLTAAFTWAKSKGKLDQPLYFFFMDHGGDGKLQLSKNNLVATEGLKAMLDDYQTSTGNPMMVLLEACYSGSFLMPLANVQRAVITSANANEQAYFVEKQGFSHFLTQYLLAGANLFEAFSLAGRDQKQLIGNNLQTQTAGDTAISLAQTPQLDDDSNGTFTTTDGQWLKTVYLNGNFKTADLTLTVENQTSSNPLTAGAAVTLQARATIANGKVERVWAILRPPVINPVVDTNGTPILAYPRLNLAPVGNDRWQTTWTAAIYNGNYQITFYAQDSDRNIANSEQDTVLTVSGGIDPPAHAQVQITTDQDRYQRGDHFQATLTEDLGWGYDLYAAILLPEGQNFLTLKDRNLIRTLNDAQPWYGPRPLHQPMTLLDLTLPADLPTGQYCLYGILSPEKEKVFETLKKGLWVMEKKCFEVF